MQPNTAIALASHSVKSVVVWELQRASRSCNRLGEEEKNCTYLEKLTGPSWLYSNRDFTWIYWRSSSLIGISCSSAYGRMLLCTVAAISSGAGTLSSMKKATFRTLPCKTTVSPWKQSTQKIMKYSTQSQHNPQCYAWFYTILQMLLQITNKRDIGCSKVRVWKKVTKVKNLVKDRKWKSTAVFLMKVQKLTEI